LVVIRNFLELKWPTALRLSAIKSIEVAGNLPVPAATVSATTAAGTTTATAMEAAATAESATAAEATTS
jgi:hypothetical protein